MSDKKNKSNFQTNLDNATPEQRERLMKNVVEAYQILYRSVLECHVGKLTRVR